MDFLYPDEYVKSVHDIDYDQLFLDGYKGIMFDVDNTLVPYDLMEAPQEIKTLFGRLQNLGFKISLVSNNNHERVYKFNERLNVYAYPRANKPLTKNLGRAMKKMECECHQTVFVGDQLFTDVWAGNAMKFHTVLVKPIQDKEQLITKVKRGLESLILNRFLRKNGLTRFR